VYVNGKENHISNALSRRVHAVYAAVVSSGRLDLKDKVQEALDSNEFYLQTKERMQQADIQGRYKDYALQDGGILKMRGRVYIPNSGELRKSVLQEMHNVPYAGHPEYQKTMIAVRKEYFWLGMKKYVAEYIAKCVECERVMVEHRHPIGLLQPLLIPEWKWEVVTIDFITKLPRSSSRHDSIMVVVDKLTKAAHFVPVRSTHKATDITKIYMKEIARLHGIPKAIVSGKDSKFTSNFWKGLFQEFGTSLNLRIAYHP